MTRKASYKNSKIKIQSAVVDPYSDPRRPEKPPNRGGGGVTNLIFCRAGLKASPGA